MIIFSQVFSEIFPEAMAGVSEEEVKSMIAKAMKEFAATLLAQAE